MSGHGLTAAARCELRSATRVVRYANDNCLLFREAR